MASQSPKEVSPRSMTTRSMGSPDTQGDWDIVTSVDVPDWGATSSSMFGAAEETGSHDLAPDGEIGWEYRALKAQVAAQGCGPSGWEPAPSTSSPAVAARSAEPHEASG